MRAGVLAATLLLPAFACAQELVTIPARAGVTQSFFIADMGGLPAQAIALLYVGGSGAINLRLEQGRIRFGDRNFLPRSRGEFIRNRILPVVMDAPSDQAGGMSDDYRTGSEQSEDARAVVRELNRRYPGLPVFVVGTSRGTITAAFVGRALGEEIAGVVLTSSVFLSAGRRGGASLRGFDYSAIRTSLLFVHHREDACPVTPYAEAAALGRRYALVSVTGGRTPESGPCEPLAPHGYYGMEPRVIDAMAAWMLKQPFQTDIR